MSLSTFLLVCTAAALHATWNLLAKKAAMAGASFVLAYRLCTIVLYAPWVIWLLWHQGMDWSLPILLVIALSAILHLAYSLFLQWGYRVADLSVVYPVGRGTAPLLSSLGAILWLGESTTPGALLGMAAIVAGIMLIATRGSWRAFRQAKAWVGVRWGLLIGLFIACYTLVDAYGVKYLAIAPVLLDWMANIGVVAMMAPSGWRQRRQFVQAVRQYWHLALGIGAIAPMGYILILHALQQGASVSIVAPLREMSLLFATIASVWLLRESVGPGRALGCALIMAGVAFLASH